MSNRVISTVKGGLAALVLLANVVLVFSAMVPIALLKLALPIKPARIVLDYVLNQLAGLWVSVNNGWIDLMQTGRWRITVTPTLKRRGWYLISANHQSWVDILVLQKVFNGWRGRVPLLKFFLKRELIYVPLMGLAWWALDFPFMRRQGGKSMSQDLAAARQACEKFRLIPTSVISFVEGTRFSIEKKTAQASPYRHLLKPKMGGISVALATLGERFDALLDVTIVYPGGIPSFWDLLSGHVNDVVVQVREVAIPNELRQPESVADPAYRAHLQTWLNEMWADKDRRIDAIVAQQREPITR